MVLLIAGFILLAVGIVGAVIPGIPGPPVSYVGLALMGFTEQVSHSVSFWIIMGLIAVIITVLDFVVPAWGTKKFNGTKAGSKGSTIGLIVGTFVLPVLGVVIGPFGILGIILGPFVGAYVGELIAHNEEHALRAAIGSFIGFLTGTFLKLVYCIVALVFAVISVV